MRLILYLLFILMPMQMMAKSTLATTDIVDEQHLLKLLDEYIDRRELYTEQKEEKIKQLKIKPWTVEEQSKAVQRQREFDQLRNEMMNTIILNKY